MLLIAAFATAAAFAATRLIGLSDELDSFPSVPAAGGTVTLQARDYVVYLEGPPGTVTTVNGVTMVDASGRAVPIGPSGSSFEYTFGDRQGASIGRVKVSVAGDYTVTADAPDGARLLFGRSLFTGLFGTILSTIALFGGLAIAGIVLIVVTAIRRRRARGGAGPMSGLGTPTTGKRWP